MVITFATVLSSAYRVSRLNIVSAIRNLPEATVIRSEATLRQRLLLVLRALGHLAIFLLHSIKSLVRGRWGPFAGYTSLAVTWVIPVVWMVDVGVALLRLAWPYLLKGLSLVTSRVGKLRLVLVTAVGLSHEQHGPHRPDPVHVRLVIFTLMGMSILSKVLSTQFSDANTVLGGMGRRWPGERQYPD